MKTKQQIQEELNTLQEDLQYSRSELRSCLDPIESNEILERLNVIRSKITLLEWVLKEE